MFPLALIRGQRLQPTMLVAHRLGLASALLPVGSGQVLTAVWVGGAADGCWRSVLGYASGIGVVGSAAGLRATPAGAAPLHSFAPTVSPPATTKKSPSFFFLLRSTLY